MPLPEQQTTGVGSGDSIVARHDQPLGSMLAYPPHKWVERTIYALFPTMMLQGTQWYGLWLEKEQQDFVFAARVAFPIIGIAYVLHYFYFDLAIGLKPAWLWLWFRLSMAVLAFATFLFYTAARRRWGCSSKWPAMISLAVFCYFQSRVLVWYDSSIYLYAFAFVIIATVILRTSILNSIVYALFLLAIQWSSFLEAGLNLRLIYSATAISLIFVFVARSNYASEVRYFLATQQNTESQKQIIELNIEFTERLKAFLPMEISKRLSYYIERKRMTVLQAIEEVLRPRRRDVSCLFSDIRGFTQSTKGDQNYIDSSVLPNVKECTKAVEDHGGIPRKIGDLIFAYFDSFDTNRNLLRCVSAGIEILRINQELNALSATGDIHRHVLVSSGEALVGNLGGFDSSIEITALGNPVNLLSRLDEITKTPQVKMLITHPHIILDAEAAGSLESLCPSIAVDRVNLPALGVKIRDFEELEEVWLMKVTGDNIGVIKTALEAPEGGADAANQPYQGVRRVRS